MSTLRVRQTTAVRSDSSVSFLTPTPPPRRPRKLPSETTLHAVYHNHNRISLPPTSALPPRPDSDRTSSLDPEPIRRHRSLNPNSDSPSHHKKESPSHIGGKSSHRPFLSLEEAEESEIPVSAWTSDAFDFDLPTTPETPNIVTVESAGPPLQISSEKPILDLEVQSPFTVSVPIPLRAGTIHPQSQSQPQSPQHQSDSHSSADVVDAGARLEVPQNGYVRRRLISESNMSGNGPKSLVIQATFPEPTTTDEESTAGSVWDDTQLLSPRDRTSLDTLESPRSNHHTKTRPLSTAISDAPSARSNGSRSSSKSYNGVRTSTLVNRIPYNLEETEGPPLDVHETIGYIHMHPSANADHDGLDARLKAVSLGFPISLRPRNIPNARGIFSSASSTSAVDYRFVRFSGLIPSMRPLRPSLDRVSLVQLGARSSNSSHYHIYGRVTVPFDAGQWSFEQECWVVDLPPGLPVDLILGMDWMERYDARVEVSLEGMRVCGANGNAVMHVDADSSSGGQEQCGYRKTRVASDTYNSMPPGVPV